MNSDFLKMFNWKEEDKYYAAQKFLFITALPGFIPISFAAGFQISSWLGALAIIPVGVMLIYFTSKCVSFYLYKVKARSIV